MIIKKVLPLFLFVLFVAQPSIMAQRVSIVRGLVSDELGGVIVGATVTLTNEQGQAQTTVSDANGNYRFNDVAPGNYSIAAIQMGFSTFQQNSITVVAGQSRTLNVTLKVAALQSQVTVDPYFLRPRCTET